jgi:hypothetical protein
MNFKFVHFLKFLTRKTYSIIDEKGFIFRVGEITSSNATQSPHHFVGPTLASIVNEQYGPIIKSPTSFPSCYNVKPSPHEPHYGSTSILGLPLLRGHVELIRQL